MSKTLEQLFPDPTVRKVIDRVIKNCKSGHEEEMLTTYHFLDKDLKKLGGFDDAACFGGILEAWGDSSDIAHYFLFEPYPSEELDDKTAYRWVKLCQELGLLSPDQTPHDIVHGDGYRIPLYKDEVYVGKVYMQLCLLRWLREAPFLVINVIDLVDNAGRDFWASVAFCHLNCVQNVDHSLLPFNGPYPAYTYDNDCSRDFALVLRLHEATVNPAATDKRLFVEELNCAEFDEDEGYPIDDFSWSWHASTVKPPQKFVLKQREMLLSGELFPVLGSASWAEAESQLKQLQKRKSSVEFENLDCE